MDCVLCIVFPSCANEYVLTCLSPPCLPAPLSLLMGQSSRKCTDPWVNSERLCFGHMQVKVKCVLEVEVEGSVWRCISLIRQSRARTRH